MLSSQSWCAPLRKVITRKTLMSDMQAHELDSKIQEVYKRIQTEKKIREASRLLGQATPNPEVLRRNEAKIKESESAISYFE